MKSTDEKTQWTVLGRFLGSKFHLGDSDIFHWHFRCFISHPGWRLWTVHWGITNRAAWQTGEPTIMFDQSGDWCYCIRKMAIMQLLQQAVDINVRHGAFVSAPFLFNYIWCDVIGCPFELSPKNCDEIAVQQNDFRKKFRTASLLLAFFHFYHLLSMSIHFSPSAIQNLWWINHNTLWLFNIAMENGPFIDDFPIKTSISGRFSMAKSLRPSCWRRWAREKSFWKVPCGAKTQRPWWIAWNVPRLALLAALAPPGRDGIQQYPATACKPTLVMLMVYHA